ncbi:P protein [Platysternon megacephalum]|uniref:P protein n=1 Tax=Platysternon megacephalum TaxID=55544 RepID=A0A4D9EGP5_9SAUR|nr:P protein [Platysternon megacephalum]
MYLAVGGVLGAPPSLEKPQSFPTPSPYSLLLSERKGPQEGNHSLRGSGQAQAAHICVPSPAGGSGGWGDPPRVSASVSQTDCVVKAAVLWSLPPQLSWPGAGSLTEWVKQIRGLGDVGQGLLLRHHVPWGATPLPPTPQCKVGVKCIVTVALSTLTGEHGLFVQGRTQPTMADNVISNPAAAELASGWWPEDSYLKKKKRRKAIG